MAVDAVAIEQADGAGLLEFLRMMRRMRAECAWKREQTHRSLERYLLEEAHETIEAIDLGDPGHLREELGDLIMQVYFHAAIAEEAGEFTLDDVMATLIEKMIRRNPHVFGDHPGADRPTAAEVEATWNAAKAREKRHRTSPVEGIPPSLPALLYADKVLDRTGLRPPAPEEDAGLGDRLLALVAEAHDGGLDPEQELRDAVRRLLSR